jgi:hypothetical protein
MTGDAGFWYRFVGMDFGERLKTREFGVVVDRSFVDPIVERFKGDEEGRKRFQRVFDERMKDFVRNAKLGGATMYVMDDEEEPWLFGFDMGCGAAALYLSRNRNDPAIRDPDRERVYRTHNCDNTGHRGVLMTVFGIWAELIEAWRD